MEKYSVKKPFTVLVAVLIVFLMGFVSLTNLRTDLLPEISTPLPDGGHRLPRRQP